VWAGWVGNGRNWQDAVMDYVSINASVSVGTREVHTQAPERARKRSSSPSVAVPRRPSQFPAVRCSSPPSVAVACERPHELTSLGAALGREQ
jgi:hypothetical protein